LLQQAYLRSLGLRTGFGGLPNSYQLQGGVNGGLFGQQQCAGIFPGAPCASNNRFGFQSNLGIGGQNFGSFRPGLGAPAVAPFLAGPIQGNIYNGSNGGFNSGFNGGFNGGNRGTLPTSYPNPLQGH
jgi:hypothetical protein